MNFWVNTVCFLLGKYPAVELLSHKVGECLVIVDTVNSDCISLCVVLLISSQHSFFFETSRSLLCIMPWIGGEDAGGISKITAYEHRWARVLTLGEMRWDVRVFVLVTWSESEGGVSLGVFFTAPNIL